MTLPLNSTVIQAKDDAEYTVEATSIPHKKRGRVEGDLYVDGIEVGGSADCASRLQPQETLDCFFEGFTRSSSKGRRVLRAFKFAKVEIQDKSEYDEVVHATAKPC